jgi:hypothetical protein
LKNANRYECYYQTRKREQLLKIKKYSNLFCLPDFYQRFSIISRDLIIYLKSGIPTRPMFQTKSSEIKTLDLDSNKSFDIIEFNCYVFELAIFQT